MNVFVNISQELCTAAWDLSPLFMEICISYTYLRKIFPGNSTGFAVCIRKTERFVLVFYSNRILKEEEISLTEHICLQNSTHHFG